MKFVILLFVTVAILAYVQALPLGNVNEQATGLSLDEIQKVFATVLCGDEKDDGMQKQEGSDNKNNKKGPKEGMGGKKGRKGKGGKGKKTTAAPATQAPESE